MHSFELHGVVRRAKISCEISIPLQTWETEEEREEMMVKAADEARTRVGALALCSKPCLPLIPRSAGGALNSCQQLVCKPCGASRFADKFTFLGGGV